MLAVQDLQVVKILQDVPAEDLATIISNLTERSFAAGETILYRGDPGYSMFMILSGTVSVTLRNDEGIAYEINRQNPGENFGEMALMTGEPRSANVVALTPVRLAELSQEAFFELVSRFPRIMDDLLRQLAQRRGRTMVREQFANLEREEIIASLFAQQPPEIDCFIGKTKWTNDINAAIERLAAGNANVLILGERGTGKDLAARLIHFHGSSHLRPLFHLDCANPPPIQRDTEAGKADTNSALYREIAQESALFGHGRHAGSYAKGIRRGYIELADGGSIVLENIDSLSPHVQQLIVTYLREGTFTRTGETERLGSTTRFIATSSRSLQELKECNGLDPDLLSLVSTETLLLKPLRERKKDIPSIADHLLKQYNRKFGKAVSGFSSDALNNLVDHHWPLNVDELHQVLERAVLISDGETITERQVFLNVPSFSTAGKFNLLRIPSFRAFADHRLVPEAVRIVTVPFILGLTFLTLMGPPQKNPANLVVWGIWWPFLIFSIMVAARSWCGYCPLPVISDRINILRKKFLPIPEVLSKYGVWLGIGGFAFILLWEHAAHMFTAARATSALLLSIIAGTTITNFFFGKRSWCKYICPLGRMVAQSSTVSMLELGTNSNVCQSQCQTHDCVKDGNCPMGIHPSAAGVSKECVLCLSCLKKCRHQSVRLSLRLPWQEFLVRDKWSSAEAFFAAALAALVLAIKLPSWVPFQWFLTNRLPFDPVVVDSAVSIGAGGIFILLVLVVSGIGFDTSWRRHFAVVGNAYLFLAFAGFFNVYFHEFVYSGPNLIAWSIDWIGLDIPREWIVPNLGTLKAVIPLITLLGGGGSLFALFRLSRRCSIPQSVSRAHQVLLVATTCVFLVIL